MAAVRFSVFSAIIRAKHPHSLTTSFSQPVWKNPRLLSIVGLVLVLFSSGGTYFFMRSQALMEVQLEDKLKTAVSIAALQFDGAVIRDLPPDPAPTDPAVRPIAHSLALIAATSPMIRHLAILRRAPDGILDLPLDADVSGMDHTARALDITEDLARFGGAAVLLDDLTAQAMVSPLASINGTNRWLAAYAPIRESNGKIDGVLVLEADPKEFLALSQAVFSPSAFLLFLLGGVCIAASIIQYLWKRRIESLEEIERQRTSLMDLALHQLGAPIATFKWWLEILHEHSKKMSVEVRDALREMDEGITRIDAIMASLTDANDVTEGTMQYLPEESSLNAIIAHEAEICRNMLDQHGQTLQLNTSDCVESIKLDRKLIGGVVRELIDNATMYSPKGTTITIVTSCRRGAMQIEVRDEGYGISKEELPKIFQKFTRGAQASKYKPVGNGLGLYTAKGIIERAGGKMWVSSELGKGSSFFFTIPHE